jgi:hypothetical protein
VLLAGSANPLDRRGGAGRRSVHSFAGRTTVAVRESFLAAMREFADEGRAGDDAMVGRDLIKWGDRWATGIVIRTAVTMSPSAIRRRSCPTGESSTSHPTPTAGSTEGAGGPIGAVSGER